VNISLPSLSSGYFLSSLYDRGKHLSYEHHAPSALLQLLADLCHTSKRADEVFDASDTDFEFHTAIEATEDIIGVTRTNEDGIRCRAIT
jgi:hypothetical protein